MGVSQFPTARDEPWQLELPGSFNLGHAPTPKGSLKRHVAQSDLIAGQREIRVYLPPSYFTANEAHFPVLYAQNGQNLFAGDDSRAPTFGGVKWNLDLALDRLIQQDRVAPCIVVAVWHNPETCMIDYTCAPDGGQADHYLRFLMEELKPFIDHRYRTRREPNSTGVIGASLGGHFSVYAGATDSRVGVVLGLSPSPHFGDGALVRAIENASNVSGRFFLDMGDQEPDPAKQGLHEVALALRRQIAQSDGNIVNSGIVEGFHGERSWGKRLYAILPQAFPPLHGS